MSPGGQSLGQSRRAEQLQRGEGGEDTGVGSCREHGTGLPGTGFLEISPTGGVKPRVTHISTYLPLRKHSGCL